jgi:hypothetical protein
LTPTRTTFQGLAGWEIALWYVLVTISTAVLFWGTWRLLLKYRRGWRHNGGLRHLPRRLARGALSVFSHDKLLRRQKFAGTGHLLIFYGFLVLFIGTAILAFQDDFARPLLHFDFWKGGFYLVYSLFLDVFGAGLIVGVIVMVITRGVLRPRRLDYKRVDGGEAKFDRSRYLVGDWILVAALFYLAVSGFLLESLRIAQNNPSFEVWSPVGWALAQGLRGIGVKGDIAGNAHLAVWWMHGRHPIHEDRPCACEPGQPRGARRARRQEAAAPARGRAGRCHWLREDHRFQLAAPGLARRLHEMWEVPHLVPGDRGGLPALATRPDPRPA